MEYIQMIETHKTTGTHSKRKSTKEHTVNVIPFQTNLTALLKIPTDIKVDYLNCIL